MTDRNFELWLELGLDKEAEEVVEVLDLIHGQDDSIIIEKEEVRNGRN